MAFFINKTSESILNSLGRGTGVERNEKRKLKIIFLLGKVKDGNFIMRLNFRFKCSVIKSKLGKKFLNENKNLHLIYLCRSKE
jgi:hypothetical protein